MTTLARLAYLRNEGDKLLEERARLLERLKELNDALDEIAGELEELCAEETRDGDRWQLLKL